MMECLYQQHWYTTVRRAEKGHLLAETAYFDTQQDVAARLRVDSNSFKIQRAEWEEHRPNAKGAIIIPDLQGVEAYFNSGPALHRALREWKDTLAGPLFSETVKGVIQAETFLTKERGYNSTAEYEQEWKKSYANSCRYYSNLDKVKGTWYDHVGKNFIREKTLFGRFKHYAVYTLEDDNLLLQGTFSDSFHEASISMKVSKKEGNEIFSVSGLLSRAPDSVCRESVTYLENLVGNHLKKLSKGEIANLLGKHQGCVHLIDMIKDAARTLNFELPL